MADERFKALMKAISEQNLNLCKDVDVLDLCKEYLNASNGSPIDLSTKDAEGNTALIKAVKIRNQEIVRAILDKLKECPNGLNVCDVNGKNAMNAVVENDLRQPENITLAQMIVKSGCDLNNHDKDDKTPLYRLVDERSALVKNDPQAFDRFLELIRMMLDAGCDVNDKSKGTTVLHCAVKTENVRLIELLLLLQYDADPKVYENSPVGMHGYDFSNPFQYDVLHTAAKTQKSKPMELVLKSQRADVDSKNSYGRTSLMMVLEMHPIECDIESKVKMLMDAGCNPTLTDNSGKSVLHILCENVHVINAPDLFRYGQGKVQAMVNILKMLLNDDRVKSLVNRQDNDKNTPLHIAVKNVQKDLVEALLSADASVDIKNKYEQTVNDIHLEGEGANEICSMLNSAPLREHQMRLSKGLTEDDLDDKTLFELARKINPSKYIDLGIQLEFDYSELESIRISNQTESHLWNFLILQKWKQRQTRNTNLRMLLSEALRKIKRMDLAEEII